MSQITDIIKDNLGTAPEYNQKIMWIVIAAMYEHMTRDQIEAAADSALAEIGRAQEAEIQRLQNSIYQRAG